MIQDEDAKEMAAAEKEKSLAGNSASVSESSSRDGMYRLDGPAALSKEDLQEWLKFAAAATVNIER